MRDVGSRRVRALLLSATLTSAATAQPTEPPELDWQAPSGCPQAEWLRERIRGLVSSRTLAESRLRVRGTVTEREDGRYRLELVMTEDSLVGQRELTSDSCQDLAGAAAVAVGLLLRGEESASGDSSAGASSPAGNEPATSATSTRPAPAAERPPPASDQPPPDDADSTSTPRSWRAVLRLPIIAVEVGPLPRPSLALAAGLGVRAGGWSVIASGAWWREQTAYGDELTEYGAELSRKTGALTLARGFALGSLELGPSATVAVEHVKARGLGPGVAANEDTAIWVSAGGGVFAALRLSEPFALFAEVGGRVQTARPPISIDGLGRVRRWGPAAFTSALGAEWSF